MRNVVTTAVSALAIVLSACGGSNPGSGTQAFFVRAIAESDGSSDGTWIAVEVREDHSGGPVVSDATVALVGDRTGEFNLPWEGINWGGFQVGAYRKIGITWDTGWALRVRRGNDHVDAYLTTPGLTSIVDPISETTFSRAAGAPLTIRWKDGENRRADIVSIDFQESTYARDLGDDPYEFRVDVEKLVASEEEQVHVVRRNEVPLAGGTPGSIFSATTRHRIQFRVE